MLYLLIILFSSIAATAHNSPLDTYIRQEVTAHRVISLTDLQAKASAFGSSDAIALMQQVIAIKDTVIVIRFSADNRCGQCKFFAGVFAKIASNIHSLSVHGKELPITYVYVDIEQFEQVMKRYSVSAIPSVLVYYNGNLISANTSPVTGFEHYLKTLPL